MAEFDFSTWMVAVPAYVILQTVALLQLTGSVRIPSLVLAVVMASVFALSIAAYTTDRSTLWQMYLIIATPPALVIVVGLLLIGYVVRRSGGT